MVIKNIEKIAESIGPAKINFSESQLKRVYKALIDNTSHNPLISGFVSTAFASFGLGINNSLMIVASTFVSPIGGYVIQASLYNFLKRNNYKFPNTDVDYSNWFLPILIVIISTLIFSYFIGKLFVNIRDPFTKQQINKNWPTQEMLFYAEPINAVYSMPIALLCGILLPLAVLNDNMGHFIGIGIATAFIPCLAQIGLAMNFEYNLVIHEPKLKDFRKRAIATGVFIFLINIILLLLPGYFLMGTFLQNKHFIKKFERYFKF